ncbi:MAG TPA: hypothetical protein G4N96_12105 [Chloroflexi bacterium]|nr:hypothetical protein [Chloroflexota bacterium]
MPTIKFTSQTMPQSGKELTQRLQTALRNSSPLDDFIQLVKDLKQLETQYQMDSEEFFDRFQRGDMGDQITFIRWANKYEIYANNTRWRIVAYCFRIIASVSQGQISDIRFSRAMVV